MRPPACRPAPLRPTTGRLTATEPIVESGLRRDVVCGDPQDLVEEFQAQAKAQSVVGLMCGRWSDTVVASLEAVAADPEGVGLVATDVRKVIAAAVRRRAIHWLAERKIIEADRGSITLSVIVEMVVLDTPAT